ncbi:cupredoxin domain-containing protein (plasmid) [Deinococcus radiomollis]|uniref:cupredoxin domain-containing protein n=1 Tax=Deinococcus radiomollis TaxID=468916 RepID=UPI0038929D10
MSQSFRLSSVLASALLLSSAGAAAKPTLTFPFKAVGTPASSASGQLTVRTLSSTSSVSVLTLRGLTPSTPYVAHYHALGPASSDPCASNGPITLGFPAFRSNAQGQATVLLRADPARIKGTLGAYVNVHTAANLAVVPLCASVLKAGGTAAQTPQPAVPAALQQTVKIGDDFFMPSSLSVAAGTTVTWTHTGKVTHNILSVDLPGIRSADLHPGESYSYTFKTPGTFTYYCSYHEGMSATITVTNR